MQKSNLVIFAVLFCVVLVIYVSAELADQQPHLALSASESLITGDGNVAAAAHARPKRWILKKLKRIIKEWAIHVIFKRSHIFNWFRKMFSVMYRLALFCDVHKLKFFAFVGQIIMKRLREIVWNHNFCHDSEKVTDLPKFHFVQLVFSK